MLIDQEGLFYRSLFLHKPLQGDCPLLNATPRISSARCDVSLQPKIFDRNALDKSQTRIREGTVRSHSSRDSYALPLSKRYRIFSLVARLRVEPSFLCGNPLTLDRLRRKLCSGIPRVMLGGCCWGRILCISMNSSDDKVLYRYLRRVMRDAEQRLMR